MVLKDLLKKINSPVFVVAFNGQETGNMVWEPIAYVDVDNPSKHPILKRYMDSDVLNVGINFDTVEVMVEKKPIKLTNDDIEAAGVALYGEHLKFEQAKYQILLEYLGKDIASKYSDKISTKEDISNFIEQLKDSVCD